jgi:hypothetical protein
MKRKRSRNSSIEKQVNNVINIMKTHEWASPIAFPLELHKDLDYWTERYLFDSYININYAYYNYKIGNYDETKRRLENSLMWKNEAIECSFISGINDFKTLLFKKTKKIFDNIINEICSDKNYLEQICDA